MYEYSSERLTPTRDIQRIKGIAGPLERERLGLCDRYHKNIDHRYLKLSDVKGMTGDRMFLAIIDYKDSIIFRSENKVKASLFPLSTIIGIINFSIYDFSEHMFLDFDKYIINYAIRFSDIVGDDYWCFYETEDRGVCLYTSSNNKKRGTFNYDKFMLCRMKLGLDSHELYDENAQEKVLKIVKL